MLKKCLECGGNTGINEKDPCVCAAVRRRNLHQAIIYLQVMLEVEKANEDNERLL